MNSRSNINYFNLRGTVVAIGDLVHIERGKIPDLYKRTLTVELSDGQKLFPEIRNVRLKQLDIQNIQANDFIELEYSFEGSEKNGKRYNNLYINKITKL